MGRVRNKRKSWRCSARHKHYDAIGYAWYGVISFFLYRKPPKDLIGTILPHVVVDHLNINAVLPSRFLLSDEYSDSFTPALFCRAGVVVLVFCGSPLLSCTIFGEEP